MARYDYGLRGQRETMGYDWHVGPGGPRYGRGFDREGMDPSVPSNRVTSPYNQDYIRDRGTGYPVNGFPYGGDHVGRVVGPEAYFAPYVTRAGTWTTRGIPQRSRYERVDYGPDYRGRYPDEL